MVSKVGSATRPGAGRSGADRLSHVRNEPATQVLIIGGGINGLATFRDLALQGINVLLVERSDYCSGASAASSHMIHGGVRYLENGEFRLVKESLQERNRLLASAPHYVKPLMTTIPMFSVFSGLLSAPLRLVTHKQGKPSERGAFLIKAGLLMYDTFGRNGGRMPRHSFLGQRRSRQLFPALNKAVKFTATYYDAAMESPERLALDVLKDALAAGPHARAANYLAAVSLDKDKVILRDSLTGEEFAVKADVIVNTSGPWTDMTNSDLGSETRYMGGTKGSHIVLDNQELFDACANREIFFENQDGRIVLMYPLLGRVLVGTTDIPHDMSEPAVCTDEEVDYFFDLVKYVFPDIEIDKNQIVFRYSGVRPLPATDDLMPGFVSRDYRIVRTSEAGQTPWLSLVGGKWTTFRALGEHLSSEVLMTLGATRVVSTESLPIGGGAGFPIDAAGQATWAQGHASSVSVARAQQLLSRYGTLASQFIETLSTGSERPLKFCADYSIEEIKHLVATEEIVHLSDLVHRRTSLSFVGALSSELLTELADIVGGQLGWNAEQKKTEIELIGNENGGKK